MTGATGFIGSRLTERLVGSGRQVVAVVRPTSDKTRLAELGVEIVSGDVCDADCATRAVERCSHVFHLAGARPANTRHAASYRRVNVDGTLTLARAALGAGVQRFVFASSASVFGFAAGGLVNEQTPAHPDTHFRVSKLAAERSLLDLGRRNGLPVTIARLSSVLGGGSTAWLPFCRAVARRDFRLIGSGANRLHLVHVSDAIEGLLRCADAARADGETFIITAGDVMTVRDYIDMVRRSVGCEMPVGRLPSAPFLAFRRCAALVFRATGIEIPRAKRYDIFLSSASLDVSKARSTLNYQPRMSSAEAAEATVRWYQQQGLLTPPRAGLPLRS